MTLVYEDVKLLMLLWMLKIMLLKVLAIAWHLDNNIFTLWHRIRIEWWQNGIAWTELRVELCSCLGNYIGKSANISCLPLAMFAREVTKVFQIFVTAAPLTPGTSRTSSKETTRTDGAIARRKDNLQKGILNNDVHTMQWWSGKTSCQEMIHYHTICNNIKFEEIKSIITIWQLSHLEQ